MWDDGVDVWLFSRQISLGISGPGAPANAKPIFNEFIRRLKAMMDGTSGGSNELARLEAMRLGMRGCGIFSGAIVTFMGHAALKARFGDPSHLSLSCCGSLTRGQSCRCLCFYPSGCVSLRVFVCISVAKSVTAHRRTNVPG